MLNTVEQSLQEHQKNYSLLADKIWDYAEIGYDEYKSIAVLITYLKELGFSIKEQEGGIPTAFSATWGDDDAEHHIGFLGEYDSLSNLNQKAFSLELEKDLEQESCNGHGCGHHLLGVAGLAAAVSFRDYIKQTGKKAKVSFFGCPAEEKGSGKTFMARAGVFDNLDIALCWHPAPVSAVLTSSMLANIQVRFRFKGQSSHAAASPHLGRSALDAMELMNVGSNYLREHVPSDVRFHYAVTNTGGISPNVVQGESEVIYLIRAPKNAMVEHVYERICKIAKGAAMMTETEVEFQIDKACSNVVNNRTIEKEMQIALESIPPIPFTKDEKDLAEKYLRTLSENEAAGGHILFSTCIGNETRKEAILDNGIYPINLMNSAIIPASSDVGDVSWVVPTAQCFSTCYAEATPFHSWQMVAQGKTSYAHKGMLHAASIMSLTACRLIDNEELINQAKKEHQAYIEKEGGYRCLVPEDVFYNGKA